MEAINKIEYTRRSTSQKKDLSEVVLSTLRGRARSMIYHANVTVKDRYSVCKEAIQCVTLLDGSFIVEIMGKGQ